MQWYHILGIYIAIVVGLIFLVLIQAKYQGYKSYRHQPNVKYPLWLQAWRWIRFIARCGRRRKRRTKQEQDRREERRALRKKLREEAEEWLSECVEKILELGDEWLDTNFDDEDDEYFGEEPLTGDEEGSDDSAAGAFGSNDSRQVVYGLVNTGNSCFFNSVLQALASAEYLQNYLTTILELMDEANETYSQSFISMPLTEALWETLTDLNTVVNRDSAFQPYAVMAALGSARLNNNEQQDAQEAFQLISTALTEEQRSFSRQSVPSLLNSELVTMLSKADKDRAHILSVPRGLESVGTKDLARVKAIMKLASLADLPAETQALTYGSQKILQNPFSGLMASRLSCAQCGYTEAVRHFAFDNVSLSLPLASSCTLEEALHSYISIEDLSEVQCRKCTLHKTLSSYISMAKTANLWLAENPEYKASDEISIESDTTHAKQNSVHSQSRAGLRAEERWRRVVLDDFDNGASTHFSDTDSDYESNSDSAYPIDPSTTSMERTRVLPPPNAINVPKIIEQIKYDAGRIAKALRTDVQQDLPGIRLRKAYSPLSTKQVIFAKLPPCLCLHLSRSAVTPEGYIVKNPCHVRFPEYLDFLPYTTNGHLITEPMSSILDIAQSLHVSEPSEQPSFNGSSYNHRPSKDVIDAMSHGVMPRLGYRLQAVVVHIGSHSYGHFITYRRKPRPPMRSGINTPRYSGNPPPLTLPSFNSSNGYNSISEEVPISNINSSSKRNGETSALVARSTDNLRQRRIVGGSNHASGSTKISSTHPVQNAAISNGGARSVDTVQPPSRSKRSWRVTDAMTAEWYVISDEDVQAVTLAEVLSSNPYLLIYERIEATQVAEYAGTPSILPSITSLCNLAKRSSSVHLAHQNTHSVTSDSNSNSSTKSDIN